MTFARPSLTDLIDRVTADVSSRMLGVEGAVLRRSLLGILAKATAGEAHMLYGYLEWISRQAIPDTAETEWLERWAIIWGITRKAADYAAGNVTFTGINASVIPAGTVVQRQDGVQYLTQAIATIASGTATAAVEAALPGAAADLVATSTVFMLAPVSGVIASATVATGGLTGGLDAETDDRLRERLLARIRNPPQGGSLADYEQWALEVAGVTRAWVLPNGLGAGTVLVHFVTDDDPGGLIPAAPKVAEVQAYMDVLRPVTADLTVAAPVADTVAMSIQITPNTAAVRAAVTAELADLFLRDAAPAGTILLSRMREAVSLAAGETNSAVTSPGADHTSAAGYIPVLGTITFSTGP